MQSLWATVYGRQKCVNVGQSSCTDVQNVHDEQYSGRLLVSAETIAKVEQEQEILKIDVWQFASCMNRSLKSVRVRLATWRQSSMTRVYEKCHSA